MLIAGLIAEVNHGSGALVAAWSRELLRVAVGQDSGDDNKLTVFVGIAAFSMLLQVLILVGVGIGAFVALKKVMAEIDEIKGKINPVIAKGQELVGKVSDLTTELTPTIKSITTKAETVAGHGAEISGMVKQKVEEFGPTISKANETLLSANQTVMDATTKTHEQLLRVNEMISSTLDATEKAGKRMVHNVTQPGRELAGLATGVKVAVQTFFDRQGKTANAQAGAPSEYSSEPHVQHTRSVADALARDRSNDIGL